MRLIIADDEINVRDGLVSIVHEVAPDARIVGQAGTVDEVVDLVRIHAPEIVLLDIRMPGGTGLDAIAERRDSDGLPLWIVVTSFPLFDYARRAISLNVFDYLLKPVSPDEMHRALNVARSEVSKRLRLEANELSSQSTHDRGLRQRDIAALAKAHIESQYNRPIGVSQIADQLGVSPNYLSTAFRKRHGETPLNYLTRVRMEESARLLLQGYRVTEVAALVGFADTRHFSRLFTRHWGEKPSEYVRNHDRSAPENER